LFPIIISAFVLGIVIGMFMKVQIFKRLKFLMWVTLALLFFMGMEIGSNDKLFESLPEIGIIAFLIAIFAIAGSVILTWIFEVSLRRRSNR